jgi:ectoine hydroxylase-related dioxygenase (phytanoyl-CoA dioxygenase family)
MTYQTQADQFARDGYTIFEGALDESLLALLRVECDDFIAREDARMDIAGVDTLGINHRGKRYFANECQRERPALRRMLFSPVMANIGRALLGPDVYFFFDQYVVKGPEEGLPFSWHQDSGYVVGNGGPVDHAPYLTCWCPLEDTTIENGTISIIPGSHREGILPHVRQSGTNDLVGPASEGRALTIEAHAGDVVAFSSLSLHASGPNRSNRQRRVYLAQYTAEPMLDRDRRQLRRNAIALVRGGAHVTFG